MPLLPPLSLSPSNLSLHSSLVSPSSVLCLFLSALPILFPCHFLPCFPIPTSLLFSIFMLVPSLLCPFHILLPITFFPDLPFLLPSHSPFSCLLKPDNTHLIFLPMTLLLVPSHFLLLSRPAVTFGRIGVVVSNMRERRSRSFGTGRRKTRGRSRRRDTNSGSMSMR